MSIQSTYIKTKFELGQTVYYIGTNSIDSGVIYYINIQSYIQNFDSKNERNIIEVSYNLVKLSASREEDLYATKEEAAIAWLANSGLDVELTEKE